MRPTYPFKLEASSTSDRYLSVLSTVSTQIASPACNAFCASEKTKLAASMNVDFSKCAGVVLKVSPCRCLSHSFETSSGLSERSCLSNVETGKVRVMVVLPAPLGPAINHKTGVGRVTTTSRRLALTVAGLAQQGPAFLLPRNRWLGFAETHHCRTTLSASRSLAPQCF